MPHIDPYQSGNVKKSSTTHALVHLLHYWLSALEEPNTLIRTCLIDFSKAFDRIDHNILFHKLKLLNIPPALLNWCASFLSDRQQRVKLQNCKSNWRTVNAGVPQGTKLVHLFFSDHGECMIWQANYPYINTWTIVPPQKLLKSANLTR